MLTLAIGIIVLPVLLWSWRRHGIDDDANLALGIIAWLVLAGTGAGLYFGLRT